MKPVLMALTAATLGLSGCMSTINYGDDRSQWAFDGECDDPRFYGPGVADTLLQEDMGHDATDCEYAVSAGLAAPR